MIKTLRIASVLAAIAAAILIKYFVLPMVVGAHDDERVDKVLDDPTVVEKFEKTETEGDDRNLSVESPLVKQAIAFAGHLNPGPPVVPPGERGPKPPPIAIVGPTSPKFRVFATMYFAENPSLSQALIDEPGRGRHWVKQASMVGHLRIEQVKDGVVVVKNSKDDTYEIPIETSSAPAPSMS